MADPVAHETQTKKDSLPQRTRPVASSPVLESGPDASGAFQRVQAGPRVARSRDLVVLQRAAGNRAASRLVQAKLTVGPVGDFYEQEADRVAAAVTSPRSSATVNSRLQRQEEEELQTMPLAATITPLAQRAPVEEEEVQAKPLLQRAPVEEEEVQTKPLLQRRGEGGFDAGPEVEARLTANKGGGSPLPSTLRREFEPRFGADFGGVRVHADAESARLNRSISAQAFTHGQDIYLGAGKSNLESSDGKRLLAHELTHTIQQSGLKRQVATVAAPDGTQSTGIQRVAGEVTGVDWDAATAVHPSEGGAMGGVMIVTVGGVEHILKPIDSGAGAKFGEKVMSAVGGAVSTDSRLIPKTSPEAAGLLQVLRRFQGQAQNAELQARWTRNMPVFEGARYIALQRNMRTMPGGGEEMQAIAKSGRLAALEEPTLLFNLGKALAADILVGNSDRFENANMENAFVVNRQQIGAIDTTTILQQYNAFLQTLPGAGGARPLVGPALERAVGEWVNLLVQGGPAVGGVMAVGSNLEGMVGAFENWLTGLFMSAIRMAAQNWGWLSSPADKAQLEALQGHVRRGFQAGMAGVTQLLQGANYRQLKGEFKALEATYGADVNFDWRAFKVRRAYILTLQSGGTPAVARQNALGLAKYMLAWKPQVRSATIFDPSLNVVPNRPADLNWKQKVGRALGSRSQAEKEAETLKKQARQGDVDADLYERVKEGAGGRRKDKALFEVQFAILDASLHERSAALADLSRERAEAESKIGTAGPQGELARKKVEYIQSLKTPFTGLVNSYRQVTTQWLGKLTGRDKIVQGHNQSLLAGMAELARNLPAR